MKVAEFAERLRALRCFNTHGILTIFGEAKDVAVSFSGHGGPRSMQPHQSRVWSPRFKTNPKAPYYDYGQKTFVGSRGESLPKALAWAKEQYGEVEFVPSPLGHADYIPKAVFERARAAVMADAAHPQAEPERHRPDDLDSSIRAQQGSPQPTGAQPAQGGAP